MTQSTFTPDPSEATRPYWDATRQHRLVLQRCASCEIYVHHPREVCPNCLGQELEWVESAGTGVIHALSVHYVPFEAMSPEDCPYVVAFIDLDEGVRFLSNVVEADPETIHVGDRVDVTWRPVAGGYHLPVFRPVMSP